jgi:hypothetical protein
LNQLIGDQKKELRRREFFTYTRINQDSSPPSHLATHLPSAEKVSPPPPPLVHELLPKTNPTYEIQLNIDVAAMFGKMNMMVLVTYMCNIPSMKREILNILQVPTKKEDPPIILNAMYLDWQRDTNPPLYLSLGMNSLYLNNCMVISRASTNVMSLKVMEHLGLKIKRPYGNVCGIDFKRVKVYGLCEDIEVLLIDFSHISLLMDIVVIDVLDSWGILLSRRWYSTLGGFLSMDLTHAYIPIGYGTFEILYSRERVDRNVMDPNSLDYVSECDYDVPQ